jgi:hypothetical protein
MGRVLKVNLAETGDEYVSTYEFPYSSLKTKFYMHVICVEDSTEEEYEKCWEQEKIEYFKAKKRSEKLKILNDEKLGPFVDIFKKGKWGDQRDSIKKILETIVKRYKERE